MNRQLCATPRTAQSWQDIDFKAAERSVKKLQMRIAKAVKEKKWGKVKALQWTLTHSFYAKALAVKQVTENQGKRTSGVDHELWDTPNGKFKAIGKLKRRGYKAQPLRRVYTEPCRHCTVWRWNQSPKRQQTHTPMGFVHSDVCKMPLSTALIVSPYLPPLNGCWKEI